MNQRYTSESGNHPGWMSECQGGVDGVAAHGKNKKERESHQVPPPENGEINADVNGNPAPIEAVGLTTRA